MQGGKDILGLGLRPGSQEVQGVLGCEEPPDSGGCCVTPGGPLCLSLGLSVPICVMRNDLASEALPALPGCMVEKRPYPHPGSTAHPPRSSGWGQPGSAERAAQLQAQQLDGPG